MAIEVKKVGHDLQDPIRLHEDNSSDIEHAGLLSEEWFVLDPGDDIMKTPADIEQDCSRRKIPVVNWRISEYKSPVEEPK